MNPNIDHASSKIEFLRTKISVLNNICNTLNPYEPISDPMKKQLSSFDINEIEDPFQITNKLIFLLENSVEDLNKLLDDQKLQ